MDVTNFTLGKYFVFNGTPSYNYRLVCSGGGTYSAPKRAYDSITIPGRNGSLLIDKGYYNDTTVKYDVSFFDDSVLQENAFSIKGKIVDRNYVENAHIKTEEIKNWLYSPVGYKELRDTWHPGEFRMAYVSSDFEPDMLDSLEGGSQTITFTCKPQRFLDSGMMVTNINGNTISINNPSNFEAIPKFKFVNSGTLTINTVGADGVSSGFTVRISASQSSPVILDCDLMVGYASDSDFGDRIDDFKTNRNQSITYTKLDRDRIIFGPGVTRIGYTGTGYILPRWWRL